MMFALWSSPNHTPIKYKGPPKKTSHLKPIYLNSNETSEGCVGILLPNKCVQLSGALYGDHGQWRWLNGYAFIDYSTKLWAHGYAQGEVPLIHAPLSLYIYIWILYLMSTILLVLLNVNCKPPMYYDQH